MAVAEPCHKLTSVGRAQEQSAGSSINVTELLARQTNRGCVKDGGQTFKVLHQQSVEKRFVSVQQANTSSRGASIVRVMTNLGLVVVAAEGMGVG